MLLFIVSLYLNVLVSNFVLQRSFGDALGPWQNVYTNSITIDNPYCSINFVDTEARGKTAFYRVVGMDATIKSDKTAAP